MDDLTDGTETEDPVSPSIFIPVGLLAFAFSGFLVRKICSSLNEHEGREHAQLRQLPNRVLNGKLKHNFVINFEGSEVQMDGSVSDDEVERHSRNWVDLDIAYEVNLLQDRMSDEDVMTSNFPGRYRLSNNDNNDVLTFKLTGDIRPGEIESKLGGNENVGQRPTRNGRFVRETTYSDGTGDWRSSYSEESAYVDEGQIHRALRVTSPLSSKRGESFHYTDDGEVDRPVSVNLESCADLLRDHSCEPHSVMKLSANNSRSEEQAVRNTHNTVQQSVHQLQHQLKAGSIDRKEPTHSNFVRNSKFCFKPISESECTDFTTAAVVEPEIALTGDRFQGPIYSQSPKLKHMPTDISGISSANIRYEPHYALQISGNQERIAPLSGRQIHKQLTTNMNDSTIQTKLKSNQPRGNQLNSHAQDGETDCDITHIPPVIEDRNEIRTFQARDRIKLKVDANTAHAESELKILSHHQADRGRNSNDATYIPETNGDEKTTLSKNSKRTDDYYQVNGSGKGSKEKLRKTKKVTFNLHNEGRVETGNTKRYSKEEIISETPLIGLGDEFFTVQVLSRSLESSPLHHATNPIETVKLPCLGVIIHQLPLHTREEQESLTPYFVVGKNTLRVKIKGREIVRNTAKLFGPEKDYTTISTGYTRPTSTCIPGGSSCGGGDVFIPNIVIESPDSRHSRHGNHLVVLNGTVLQPFAVSSGTDSKDSNQRDILPGVLVPISDSKRANLTGSYYQGHLDIPVPLISFSGDVYRVVVPKQAINCASVVKKSLTPSSSLPGILLPVPLGVSKGVLSTIWPANQGPEVTSQSEISQQTNDKHDEVHSQVSSLTQKLADVKSEISDGTDRKPSTINQVGKIGDISAKTSQIWNTPEYNQGTNDNGGELSQTVPYNCEYVAFGKDVFKVVVLSEQPLNGSNDKLRGYLTSLSPALQLPGIGGEDEAVSGPFSSTQSQSAKGGLQIKDGTKQRHAVLDVRHPTIATRNINTIETLSIPTVSQQRTYGNDNNNPQTDQKLVHSQLNKIQTTEAEPEQIPELSEKKLKQGKNEYRDILESEFYQDLCSDGTKEKRNTRKIVRNKIPWQSVRSLRSIEEEAYDIGETYCHDNPEETSLPTNQRCRRTEIRKRTEPRGAAHASRILDVKSDDFSLENAKEDTPKRSSVVTVCYEISNKKSNSAPTKAGTKLSGSLVTHCLHNTLEGMTIDVSNGRAINTTTHTITDCVVQSPLDNECVMKSTDYVSSTPCTAVYSNGTKSRKGVNTIDEENNTLKIVGKGNETENVFGETKRRVKFVKEDYCKPRELISATEKVPEDKLKWNDDKLKVDNYIPEGKTKANFMDVPTKEKKGKKVKVLQVPVSDPNLLRYAKIGPKRVVIVRDPKVIEAEQVKAQKKAQKKPKGRLIQLAPDNDDDRYSIKSGVSSQSLRRSFRRPAPRPGSPTSLPDQALVRGMNGRSSLPPNFREKRPPDWDQFRGGPRQRSSTGPVDMHRSGKPRPPRSLPDFSSYQQNGPQRDFPDGHTYRKQIYDVPSNNQVFMNNAKRSEVYSEKHYRPTGYKGAHSLPRNLPLHSQNGQQETESRQRYNRPRNPGSLPAQLQSHGHRNRSTSPGKIERGSGDDMQQHHHNMPRTSSIHPEDNGRNDVRYRQDRLLPRDQFEGSSKNLRLQSVNGMGHRSTSLRNVTPIEFDNARQSQMTTHGIEVNSPVIDRRLNGSEENHLRLPVSHNEQSDRGSSDENSVFSHGSQSRPRNESAFGEGGSSGESQRSNEPKVIKAQDVRVETCFYWEPGLETRQEREKKKERERIMGKETAGVFTRSSGTKGSIERQLERERRNEDLKHRAMMQGIPKQKEHIYDKPVTKSFHPMPVGSLSALVRDPSNPADHRVSEVKLKQSNDPQINNDDYHRAQHYSKPFSQQSLSRENATLTRNVSGDEVPSSGKKVVGQPKETTFGVESNIRVMHKETSLCDPPEDSFGALAMQYATVSATQSLESEHGPNKPDEVSISGSRIEPVQFQRMETSFSEPDGKGVMLRSSNGPEQHYQEPAPPNKPKSIETIFAEPERLPGSHNRMETSFYVPPISHKEEDTSTSQSENYPPAQHFQGNEYGDDNGGSHYSSDDDSLMRNSGNESENGQNSIKPSRFGAVRVTQKEPEPEIQSQHRSQQHAVRVQPQVNATSNEVPNGSIQGRLGKPRGVASQQPVIQQTSDPAVQKTPKLAVPKPVQPAVKHSPRIAIQQPSKPVVLQRPKLTSEQSAKPVAQQSPTLAVQQQSRMSNQQPKSASQQPPIPNAQSQPKPVVKPKPKIAIQQPRKIATQESLRMAVQHPQKTTAQQEPRIAVQKPSKIAVQQLSQTVGQQDKKPVPQQLQRPLAQQSPRPLTQHSPKVAVSLPSKPFVDQQTTQSIAPKPAILKRPQNLPVAKPPAHVAQPQTVASQQGQGVKASRFVNGNTTDDNFNEVNESAHCNELGSVREPFLEDESKPTLHATRGDTNNSEVTKPNEAVDEESCMASNNVGHVEGPTDRLPAKTTPQPKPRTALKEYVQAPDFRNHVQEHVLPSKDQETLFSPNTLDNGPQSYIAGDNASSRSQSISSDSEKMETNTGESGDESVPKKPFSTVFCLRGVKINRTVIPLPQHSEVHGSVTEPCTGYSPEGDAHERSGYTQAVQNEKMGNDTKTFKAGEPFKQQEDDLISPLSISESSATTITEPDSDRDGDNSISMAAPVMSLLNMDLIESERFDKKRGRPIPSPRPPLSIKPPGGELSKFKFEETEEQPDLPPPPQYSDTLTNDNVNESAQHPQTSSVYHPSVYMSNPATDHPMSFGYKPSYSQNGSVTAPAVCEGREDAVDPNNLHKQYSVPDSAFPTFSSNVTSSDEKITSQLNLSEYNSPQSPQMEIPEEAGHKSNEGSNTVDGNDGRREMADQQGNSDRYYSYTYDEADHTESYQPYGGEPLYEYHSDFSHHYHNAEVDHPYPESSSSQGGTMYYPAVDVVGYDEYDDGYSQSQGMPSLSTDDYMHFSDLQSTNQPEYHSRAGTMYIPDLDEYDDDFDDDVEVGDTALDYFPDYAMEPIFQRLETIPEEVEPWSNDTSEYSSAEDTSSAEEGDVSVSPRTFDPYPSFPSAATLIEHVPLQDAMAAEVGSGVESESSSSTLVQNSGGETNNSSEKMKTTPSEREMPIRTDDSLEDTAGHNEKKSADPDYLFPSTDDIRREKSPVSLSENSDEEDESNEEDEEVEIEVCLDDDASENSAFIMEDGDLITDEESDENAETDSKQSFDDDDSSTAMNRSFVIALVGQTSIVQRGVPSEITPVHGGAPLVENEDLEDSGDDDHADAATDHESPIRIISPLKIRQPIEDEVIKIAEVVEQTSPEEDKNIGVKAIVSPTKAINLNYSKVPVKVIMSQTALPQTVQYPSKIAVSEVATTRSVAQEPLILSKDEDVLSTVVKNTPPSFERNNPFRREHTLNITSIVEDISEANEPRTGDKNKVDPNMFSVTRKDDPTYKHLPQVTEEKKVNGDPFLLDEEKENVQCDIRQSPKPSRDRSGRRKFRKLQGNARAAIQDVITDLETNLGVEMSKEDKQDKDSCLATTEFGKQDDIDQRNKEPEIQTHITEEQRSSIPTQRFIKPVQQKDDSVRETQPIFAAAEKEALYESTAAEKEAPQESEGRTSDISKQKDCSAAQNATAWHQDLDSVPKNSPPISNPVVENSNTTKNSASKEGRISAKPCPVFDIDSLKFEIPNYDKIFSEVKSQQKPVHSKKASSLTEPDVAPEIPEELPTSCEYTDDGVIDRQLQRMRQNLKQMTLPDWFRKSPQYDKLITSGNVRSLPSYWTFKPKRLTASTPATPTGERKQFSTISTQLPFLTAASFRRKDFSRPDDGRISPANSLPDSWTFDALNVQTQGLSPNTSASPSPNQTKPSESRYNFKEVHHPEPRQLFQMESAEEPIETEHEPPQFTNESMTSPNLPREMEVPPKPEDQHTNNEGGASRAKTFDTENEKQSKRPTVNPAVRSASGSAVFCLTSSMFGNYSTPTPVDSNDHVNNNAMSNSYLSSDCTGSQPAVEGGEGGIAFDYDVEISSSDEVFSSEIKPYYNPSSNWISGHLEDEQGYNYYSEEQPEAAPYYTMQV